MGELKSQRQLHAVTGLSKSVDRLPPLPTEWVLSLLKSLLLEGSVFYSNLDFEKYCVKKIT